MKHTRTQQALEVLRATNKALETAVDEQQLLGDICRIAVEVGGYRFSWIGYAEHDAEKSVRFMACAGHHPDYLKVIKISWAEDDSGRGPAGIAIRTGNACAVQHIKDNPSFRPWYAVAIEFGYQSVIALPLRWQGATFGCLAILSGEADAFGAEEAGLLGELAASLSYGINALRTEAGRARAELELRTERDAQEILRRILSLSLEKLSLEQKLDRTLELLFDVPWLSLERKGSVFLVNEGGNTLQLVSRRYLSPVLVEKCASVPFGHCLCGRAAASGELLFHGHLDADHETSFPGIEDHGHYCQPIHSAKGVIGLLNLYVAAGHEPKPVEAPFLRAVADTLAGVIERERAEMARQRLVTILEATPDLVTITDTQGRCLYCNAGARALMASGSCTACEASLFAHYPPAISRMMREEAYPAAIAAGIWEGEVDLLRPDGSGFPVSQLVMAHRDGQGNVAYVSTVARDISDRKRAEAAAQAAALREKNFANTIINSLPGIFYLVDREGRLLRWNSNLETTLGYPGDQLRALTLRALVEPPEWDKMAETCSSIMEFGSASVEISLRSRGGKIIPFYINGVRIDSAESGPAVVGMGIDISYRHMLESELRRRATTDALTGVFNRLKMEELLEQELKKSERYSTPLSIVMFDVDYFKRVNDTFGHDVGDDVLRQVAQLTSCQLRDVDALARWGGEEFMIVATSTAATEILVLAERVRLAIAQHSFPVVGHVSASFGLGEFLHNETQKDFIKRVDDALYAAKKAGRNCVVAAR